MMSGLSLSFTQTRRGDSSTDDADKGIDASGTCPASTSNDGAVTNANNESIKQFKRQLNLKN